MGHCIHYVRIVGHFDSLRWIFCGKYHRYYESDWVHVSAQRNFDSNCNPSVPSIPSHENSTFFSRDRMHCQRTWVLTFFQFVFICTFLPFRRLSTKWIRFLRGARCKNKKVHDTHRIDFGGASFVSYNETVHYYFYCVFHWKLYHRIMAICVPIDVRFLSLSIPSRPPSIWSLLKLIFLSSVQDIHLITTPTSEWVFSPPYNPTVELCAHWCWSSLRYISWPFRSTSSDWWTIWRLASKKWTKQPTIPHYQGFLCR